MYQLEDFLRLPKDYPELDTRAAADRLAAALSYQTLGAASQEETNWEPFLAFQEYLIASFPLLFSEATLERIDKSLLICLEGKDKDLDPVLFISHQDVVPVVPGTEDDWTCGAFEGVVDEHYIWGRGALDMKSHLMGTLEAIELMLAESGTPKRTIYIGLGQDEETFQTGAAALADVLAKRGVHPVALLDEGDYSIHDLSHFGLKDQFALMVCLAEKGYADIKITVESKGGHSSLPFGGSSLEHLSKAVVAVCEHPWQKGICAPVEKMIDAAEKLAEKSGQKLSEPLAKRDLEALLADPYFYSYLTTTVAPTMITGSSTQPNVLPQTMSATINFRTLPGILAEDILETVKEIVGKVCCEAKVELLGGESDGSNNYQIDMDWVDLLGEVVSEYYQHPKTHTGLALLPSLVVGATDARLYEKLGTTCLRFSPFVADAEEIERGVHGTDERIVISSYIHGIKVIAEFARRACWEG